MSTDVMRVAETQQFVWDAQMIETVKQTVCKGATDAQLKMFIEVCKATGLNPFLKEIWFVPNVGVMAGRDGYLRIANDHPQFDGMSTVVERDDQGIPIKATCSVWRKDRAHPITCEAFYNEYRKSSQVWQTYKSAMISKVAEVLALKRSFSINGIVTEEEIGEQKLQAQDAQHDVAARKIEALQASAKKGLSEVEERHAALILEANAVLDEVSALGDAPAVSSAPRGVSEGGANTQKSAQSYEQRHTALILEANAVLDEGKPDAAITAHGDASTLSTAKATRKRGTISFKALAAYKEVKDQLRAIVGDDHVYYDILKLSKVDHADALNAEQSKDVYKLLANTCIKLRNDKNLKDEVEAFALKVGPYAFKATLENHKLQSIDEVLAMPDATALQAFLQELRSTA